MDTGTFPGECNENHRKQVARELRVEHRCSRGTPMVLTSTRNIAFAKKELIDRMYK